MRYLVLLLCQITRFLKLYKVLWQVLDTLFWIILGQKNIFTLLLKKYMLHISEESAILHNLGGGIRASKMLSKTFQLFAFYLRKKKAKGLSNKIPIKHIQVCGW